MKKIIALIVILGITVSFTACGDGKGENRKGDKNGAVSGMAASQGSTEVENKTEKAAAGEFHVLANLDVQEGVRCINENGYYYITEESEELKGNHYGRHLMYMDFATQREVYLCSTSGCKHDTEECTAVLADSDFPEEMLVFCYGKFLFVVSMDYDRSGTTEMNFMDGDEWKEPESHPAALYRMNLDGSGRTKVYEFDEGLTVEKTVLEAGGELYFIIKKMETRQLGKNKGNYTFSSERRVVKLDLESGSLSPVYQFESSKTVSEWTILGCFGHSLVLSALCYDHAWTDEEMLEDDKEAIRELMKKSRNQIAVLDLSNQSMKIVYDRSNKSEKLADYIYRDGIVYMSEEGDQSIRQLDLSTGKTRTLTKLKNNNLMGIYKDVICCQSWDLADDHTLYFINRKNGDVMHCGLVNKTLGWALDIVGETEDKFLVIYDYDATAKGDGSYEITRNHYALISKEDLYHGRGNYLPVRTTGKGW